MGRRTLRHKFILLLHGRKHPLTNRRENRGVTKLCGKNRSQEFNTIAALCTSWPTAKSDEKWYLMQPVIPDLTNLLRIKRIRNPNSPAKSTILRRKVNVNWGVSRASDGTQSTNGLNSYLMLAEQSQMDHEKIPEWNVLFKYLMHSLETT